jgi:hypothetical protein
LGFVTVEREIPQQKLSTTGSRAEMRERERERGINLLDAYYLYSESQNSMWG